MSPPRPTFATLESLRVTLQQLEQNADQADLAELKRILIQRIAELEAFFAEANAAAELPSALQAAEFPNAPGITPVTAPSSTQEAAAAQQPSGSPQTRTVA